MKQTIIIIIYIFLILNCLHCSNDYKMLAGEWQSTKISYPDPVFEKLSNQQESPVKLHLTADRTFTFSWGKTYLSGNYEIKGNEVMFIGEEEAEVTICTFHVTQDALILKMNYGFIFELQKE